MKSKLLLLILLFLVISCDSKKSSRNTDLIYWSANNTQEMEFAAKIVKDWNEKYPDNKVLFQPVPEGQSSEEVILAAVVGETTPDIYSNMWEGDVEAYAQAGVLIPLDTLSGFMDFLNERCDSATIVEVTSLDGHIYQIPWKINPIIQLYNKKIFEEAGFERAPRTYSEFLEAGRRIQKDTDGDGYVDRWIGYAEVTVTWWQRFFDFYPLYLAASGGKPLVENDKAVFNNDAALKVFTFLREVYKQKYFPKERISARQDAFLSSAIASRFTGPWEIAHAEKFKPKGFEYDFYPMPVPDDYDKPSFTYGDPKNIVIFNTCPNPSLAFEFIKYALSEENDLKFLEITGQLPRRKDIDINKNYTGYFEKNPKMRIFAAQARYVRGTDQSPVLKEVFDLISQEYEACVIYGVKTPKQALDDAEKAVNLLFIK